jgi:ATP-dependent DNA ligase
MDVTARFREIAESPSLAANLADGTVLDGEIVAFDPAGRPSFSLLAPRIQGHRVNAVRVTYVVFDILRWEGQDVVSSPCRTACAAPCRARAPSLSHPTRSTTVSSSSTPPPRKD